MDKKTKPKDGKNFLMMLLAFFFVMCSANAVFVYFALHTYAGTVTDRPYEKGLEYNKVIEAAQTQKDTGVLSDFKFDEGEYVITLQTSDGTPIDDASIRTNMVRAIKAGSDFDIDLVHKGNGRYAANIKTPYAGLWIAKTRIEWKEKIVLRSDNLIVQK